MTKEHQDFDYYSKATSFKYIVQKQRKMYIFIQFISYKLWSFVTKNIRFWMTALTNTPVWRRGRIPPP
jgi:hypothetical protein